MQCFVYAKLVSSISLDEVLLPLRFFSKVLEMHFNLTYRQVCLINMTENKADLSKFNDEYVFLLLSVPIVTMVVLVIASVKLENKYC